LVSSERVNPVDPVEETPQALLVPGRARPTP
jgi:hypothetical protein